MSIFNYIYWHPSLELFSILGYSVRWYGVLWVIGLVGAYLIVKQLYVVNKIDEEKFDPLFFYAFIGVLLGARIGHCLFYEPDYYLCSLKHFVEMFVPIRFTPDGAIRYIGYAGLASHGGVIGLLVSFWLYSIRNGVSFLFVLDCAGFAAPFTSMSIRLGNLMNSEIIGRQTDVPWAFVFENIDMFPRHPAQLYEALFYMLIFLLGIIIYRNTRLRYSFGTGFYFGYCISTIFVFRFFVEFVKEVQVDFENDMLLDMGQLLSIPLVIVGAYYVCKTVYKNLHGNL